MKWKQSSDQIIYDLMQAHGSTKTLHIKTFLAAKVMSKRWSMSEEKETRHWTPE